MSHSRKLIAPALAAMTIIGFMSLGANAGSLSDGNDDSVMVDSGQTPTDQIAGDESNDPHHRPVGGGGEDAKNETPPQNPPAPGMTKENFDFGFGHVRRRFTCFNGYQTVLVRDIRECRFGIQRRVVVGGGYYGKHIQRGYAYGGGYTLGGGYAYGGRYAMGGGYSYGGGYAIGGGYVYQQPIVRYYRPASRAAVMQAEKRARRAAQYNYGAGYGYDIGGQVGGGYAAGGYVGGYGYDNGGYPAGYGAQFGYGEGLGGGYGHKAKRGHRRHKQAYGMMSGYGYDAGYGVGFGYGGTVVHYGPVITKDGAY